MSPFLVSPLGSAEPCKNKGGAWPFGGRCERRGERKSNSTFPPSFLLSPCFPLTSPPPNFPTKLPLQRFCSPPYHHRCPPLRDFLCYLATILLGPTTSSIYLISFPVSIFCHHLFILLFFISVHLFSTFVLHCHSFVCSFY